MKQGLLFLLPAAAALLVLPGCGSGEPMGKVTGKVTFNGSAVTEGIITFENTEQGGIGAGELGSDGTYTLFSTEGGLKPGTYQVAIMPPEVELPSDGNSAPSMGPKDVDNIPEKYRNGKTSGFEVVVEDGKNEFDFDMQ